MTDTLKWVDANGAVHDLTDASGARALRGVEGRFMPPVSFIEEAVPLQPGARLRHTKTLPREVVVPIYFFAASETAFRSALRTWLGRLNVDKGPGKLRVVGPGGDTRDLNALYAAGMEIIEGPQTGGPTWQKAVIVFRAVDPYWYDPNETSQSFAAGVAAIFFPFFPLVLSSSEVYASTAVTNDGDVEAWPSWTITGPGTNPVLRNLTTGKKLAITKTLVTGESILIDTAPGVKTVKDGGGVSLYDKLSADSSLWSLEPGVNSVTIELSGAVPAVSSVVLRYKRRYLGA